MIPLARPDRAEPARGAETRAQCGSSPHRHHARYSLRGPSSVRWTPSPDRRAHQGGPAPPHGGPRDDRCARPARRWAPAIRGHTPDQVRPRQVHRDGVLDMVGGATALRRFQGCRPPRPRRHQPPHRVRGDARAPGALERTVQHRWATSGSPLHRPRRAGPWPPGPASPTADPPARPVEQAFAGHDPAPPLRRREFQVPGWGPGPAHVSAPPQQASLGDRSDRAALGFRSSPQLAQRRFTAGRAGQARPAGQVGAH